MPQKRDNIKTEGWGRLENSRGRRFPGYGIIAIPEGWGIIRGKKRFSVSW